MIASCFVTADDQKSLIYGNHTVIDVESLIRRSEIELANYELKQGLLSLADQRGIDSNLIDKVNQTICAIANNGPKSVGKILIGVSDKEKDAARIKALDHVEAKKVGSRFVVGVAREAKNLGLSMEQYFSLWKDGIKNSDLSSPLKSAVLSNIDYNSFYGLGIIVLTIPPQSDLSFLNGQVYWRSADSTELADNARKIAELAKRF